MIEPTSGCKANIFTESFKVSLFMCFTMGMMSLKDTRHFARVSGSFLVEDSVMKLQGPRNIISASLPFFMGVHVQKAPCFLILVDYWMVSMSSGNAPKTKAGWLNGFNSLFAGRGNVSSQVYKRSSRDSQLQAAEKFDLSSSEVPDMFKICKDLQPWLACLILQPFCFAVLQEDRRYLGFVDCGCFALCGRLSNGVCHWFAAWQTLSLEADPSLAHCWLVKMLSGNPHLEANNS